MQFLQIFCICMWCCIILWQFAKRTQITFGAVSKGYRSPFWITFHAEFELHATPIMSTIFHVNNIPLGELHLEKKQNGCKFKILFTIHGFYTNLLMKTYRYPTIQLSGQSNLVLLN
jgi:hypothetical protein